MKKSDTIKIAPRPDGISLYVGDCETHKRLVTLSDGNTYSVELEMTLEHR